MAKNNNKDKASDGHTSAGAQKLVENLVEATGEVGATGDLNQVHQLVMISAKKSTPSKEEWVDEAEQEKNAKILEGMFSDAESEDEQYCVNADPTDAAANVVIAYEPDTNRQNSTRNRNRKRAESNDNDDNDKKKGVGQLTLSRRGKQQATYSSRDKANGRPMSTRQQSRQRENDEEDMEWREEDEKDIVDDAFGAGTNHNSRRTGPRKSSPKSNKKSHERNPHANEHILEDLIRQAEFELEHDAYRGMGLVGEGEENGNANNNNPWMLCKASPAHKGNAEENRDMILNIGEVWKDDPDGSLLAKAWVAETSLTRCPTSIEWTRDSIAKERQAKKKKGKRRKLLNDNKDEVQPPEVAQRPLDPKTRCPCDYNPFCMCTLGGIVNETCKENTETIFEKRKKQYANLQEMERVQLAQDRSANPYTLLRHGAFPQKADKDTSKQKELINLAGDGPGKSPTDCDNEEMIEVLDNPGGPSQDGIDYAPQTADQIGKLRLATMVERQPIREYLEQIVQAANPQDIKDLSAPQLLETFAKWHSSLIFQNPFKDTNETATRLPIALPPGISNLGATCYLNTQLQCLAQNKAFLKGIGSWRAAEKNGDTSANSEADQHSQVMNNVLTSLQSLLANMVEGWQKSVTTLDFSTALGLEHDEQQDPNEFARLLFERMHEAFQEQESLRTLLPSLFEGNTTYYTTCLSCKKVSTRQESFMDLNLPIVRLPDEEDNEKGKKKGFGKRITDFFQTIAGKGTDSSSVRDDVDTTLQYCLDMYSSMEDLKGDNQYFCSTCGCKQDATRETALGSVPPVLNIQLSRYVFDMGTMTKKKLTDKVLLPRKLTVHTKQSTRGGDSTSSKTYVLCAVMKHQGNSAYRGHYVAEVQDFLSGQWFEFNDEKVTPLKDGPSCSYMPTTKYDSESEDVEMIDVDAEATNSTDGSKAKKKKPKKLVGSEEAYNTYYVEEEFLSTTVLQTFESLEEKMTEAEAKKQGAAKGDIFQSVARERQSHFRSLTTLCIEDGRATDRVRKRKAKLKKTMLAFKETIPGGTASPVWVDAALLRSFASGDRLDDLFLRTPAGSPLFHHKHLLCSHGGLHPRIARRGKLLPRHVYDSYETIMASERCLCLGEDDIAERPDRKSPFWNELNDYHIYPNRNLKCEQCVDSYRKELREKLDSVKRLHSLYIELDSANVVETDPYPSSLGDDNSDSGGFENYTCAFLAEKKHLTNFRKRIESDLLKGLGNVLATTVTSTAEPVNIESLAEGIDALDLSMFKFDDDTSNDFEDIRLNSSITCPHGLCNLPGTSGRGKKVLYLTPGVWLDLKKVFPKAIEHKVNKDGKGVDARTPCPDCKQELDYTKRMEDKLKEWKRDSFARRGNGLKELFNDKCDRVLQSFVAYSVEGKERDVEDIEGTYVPIARSDVVLWRDLVRLVDLMGGGNKKKTALEVKERMENQLSLNRPDWVKHADELLPACFLRKLMCEHGMAMPFFEEDESTQDASNKPVGIVLLSEDEYRGIVDSIGRLLAILSSKMEDGKNEDEKVIDLLNDDPPPPPSLEDSPKIMLNAPVGEPDEADDCESIRIVAPADYSKPVYLSCFPQFCMDKDCRRKYIESLLPQDHEKILIGETGDDPIVLSDGEEPKGTFALKVFEVKEGEDLRSVFDTLLDHDNLPGISKPQPGDGAPRRSKRKRSPRFPQGPILSECTVQTAMDNNQAALRMLLYEVCGEKFELDEKLILVVPPSPTDKSNEEKKDEKELCPRHVELPFESHAVALKDFYADLTKDPEMEGLPDPSKSLIILRQAVKDSSVPHECLMDALLESANTISKDDGDGKKKKPAERGFTGTLLFGRRQATDEAASNKSDDKEGAGKEETPGDTSAEKMGKNKVTTCDSTSADDKESTDKKEDACPMEIDKPAKTTHKAGRGSPRARSPPRNGCKPQGGKKRQKEEPNAAKQSGNGANGESRINWSWEGKESGSASENVGEKEDKPSVLEVVGVGDDGYFERQVEQVSDRLFEMFPDKDKCFKAASWAVENNKGKDIDQLAGIAGDKMLAGW